MPWDYEHGEDVLNKYRIEGVIQFQVEKMSVDNKFCVQAGASTLTI